MLLDPIHMEGKQKIGDYFIQFCSVNTFKIGSLMFQHKDRQKIMWISNGQNASTQLDIIILQTIQWNIMNKQRKTEKSSAVFDMTHGSGLISRQRQQKSQQPIMTWGHCTTFPRVSSAPSSRPGPIKAKDRTLLAGNEKKLVRWVEHFCEVLYLLKPTNPAQQKDPESNLPINLNDFKEEDVQNTIKMLKNNRSLGTDGITAKMLKAGGWWGSPKLMPDLQPGVDIRSCPPGLERWNCHLHPKEGEPSYVWQLERGKPAVSSG